MAMRISWIVACTTVLDRPNWKAVLAAALPALVALAQGTGPGVATADTITVSNVSPGPGFAQRTAVLSDLTVFTTNPFVPSVEILKSGDATDDVKLVSGGQPFSRTLPQELTGFQISETLNGKEFKSAYLGTRTRIERRTAMLADSLGDPLFLTVDDSLLLNPPTEGALLTFTGGLESSHPDWFVEDLNPITGLLEPYTGSASVISTRLVVGVVPLPPALTLVGAGVVALWWWGRRCTRVRGAPASTVGPYGSSVCPPG
jgi:hypothetical protein